MKCSNIRGIGLFELLVLIALFAAILLSVSPSLKGAVTPNSPKSESKRLKELIEFLHLNSRLREERITLTFQNGDLEGLSLSHKFFKGKVASVLSPEEGEIFFYPSGVVSPKTLSLTLRDETCRVTVSLRGRVKTLCH